jgi:hypothetical protein
MRHWIWHTAFLALLMGTQGTLGLSPARASGLFDWMSRCGSRGDAEILCYPMVTVSDCCAPSVCCSPTVVYPSQPSCCGAPAAQPLVAAGPPQTYYRTSWERIPVTSYRPVVATDPATGCPVTLMKPCTTYEWQAQRKEWGCGLLSKLFGCDDRPAPQVQYCVPTMCCESSDCGGSAVSGGCCQPPAAAMAPLPSSPSPTPAPYYAPGPPSVLTPSPTSGAPSPTLAPGPPPAAGAVPSRTQPPAAADTRPTLKPVAPEGSAPAAPMPPGSGAPTTDPAPPDMQALPSLGAPVEAPENSRLAPIPDPSATPVSPTEQRDAPPLLNPRDQVASLRTGQHWAVTPVSGSVDRRQSDGHPSAAPARRDFREWDESGWHSVRKAP